MKSTFILLCFLLSMTAYQAQIVINEVIFAPGQAVEIKNLGTAAVDVSSYQLCSFPTYNSLGSLILVTGNLNLAPGALLVVSGHNFDVLDDELGLYISGPFGTAANMRDYVEWGSTGHTRSSVAVEAGMWTTGDFVDGVSGQASLEYDGDGDTSSDWNVAGENSQGAENSNVVVGCEASAFAVGSQSICEGGTATFQMILTGVGPWTFTYSLDGVVQEAEVATTSPHPWMLTEAGFYNLISVTDAQCEGEASGTVQVNYIPPPTGNLSGTSDFCTGDEEASLIVELGGQGPWTIEYQIDGVDQPNIMVGTSPAIIPVSVGGFYELTAVYNNNCNGDPTGSVDVSFVTPDGGDLTYNGSTDPIPVCVDNGVNEGLTFDVTGSVGSESIHAVTDDAGVVLLVGAGPFDFEGSGAGTCQVWNISYLPGLTGLEQGNVIPDDLDGCYGLSNPISIVKQTGNDCTSSLEDLAGLNGLTLFPNPVADDLNVRFDLDNSLSIRISITDLMGQLLIEDVYNGQLGANFLQLDVDHLSSGIYILSMSADDRGSVQRKFMK